MPDAPLPDDGAPLVAARGVYKAFGEAVVLRDVSLALHAGEVVSIVGENGAGKSTLMKVLAGVHAASRGEVRVGGEVVSLSGPEHAQRLGIALIHQEPLSFPDLTVGQNIAIGAGRVGLGGRATRASASRFAAAVIGRHGLDLNPDAPMDTLSIADQQLVEIVSALAREARVIIMDEPTAPLTPSETRELFGFVRELREGGACVVFISHRLDEVLEISDRVAVLRDGALVATLPRAEIGGTDRLVSLMIGRDLVPGNRGAHARGRVALSVRGLARPGHFRDVSFDVHRGEIVGFGGLVGAGRTAVAEAMFGISPVASGAIEVGGEPFEPRSPRDAMARGLAFVPEDRARDGLFGTLSVAANITAADPASYSKGPFLAPGRQRAVGQRARARFNIRAADLSQPISDLSGGNQQKAIIARWLLTDPAVLILDEPTRGVDVGAREEIVARIRALAAEGRAIMLVSSDMAELIELSDRVVVFSEGEITAELTGDAISEDAIMRAAVSRVRAHVHSAHGSEALR